MAPGSRPQQIRWELNPPAVAGRSGWQADPGIRRQCAVREATLFRGAIRDLSGPRVPRAPRRFSREPHGIALQFAGNAPESYAVGYSILWLNSRNSQALARSQQRFRKAPSALEYAADLTPVVAAKEARASWNARGMAETA